MTVLKFDVMLVILGSSRTVPEFSQFRLYEVAPDTLPQAKVTVTVFVEAIQLF